MTRITPTPGRIVWFNGNNRFNGFTIDAAQPMAATVAFVHPGERTVNLVVTDHVGAQHPIENVPLLQEDDEPVAGPWCCWMPYQIGQAKKHEAPPVPIVEGKATPVVDDKGTGFAAIAGDVAKDMTDQANGPGAVEDTGGGDPADGADPVEDAADDAAGEATTGGKKRRSKG